MIERCPACGSPLVDEDETRPRFRDLHRSQFGEWWHAYCRRRWLEVRADRERAWAKQKGWSEPDR